MVFRRILFNNIIGCSSSYRRNNRTREGTGTDLGLLNQIKRTAALLLAIIIIPFATAYAQSVSVAVMALEAKGISSYEADVLTDRLRNELFRLGAFDVVERGLMETILDEQDFQLSGCTSNECLIEVGRLVGAKQIIGGSVGKLGKIFTISARLVDVESGRLITVSDYDLEGGLEDLLTIGMREVAKMLTGSLNIDITSTGRQQPIIREEQKPIIDQTTERDTDVLPVPEPARGYLIQGSFLPKRRASSISSTQYSRLLISTHFPPKQLFLFRKHRNISLVLGYYYLRGSWSTIEYGEDDRYHAVFALIKSSRYRLGKKYGRSIFTGLGVSIIYNSWTTVQNSTYTSVLPSPVLTAGISVFQLDISSSLPPVSFELCTFVDVLMMLTSYYPHPWLFLNLGFNLPGSGSKAM